METIPFDEVHAIRDRFARAHVDASEKFRASFGAQADLPPNERWRTHLEIQAAAMLDGVEGVQLPHDYRIAYIIRDRLIIPIVIPRSAAVPSVEPDDEKLRPEDALYPFFKIAQTPGSLLEYWILVSELFATSGWSMTRLIANGAEYNEALARMKDLQLVKALFVSYLPSAEFREDGTAVLEVTVYTRADEERVERRELLLDKNHEFHFHSRELIAEGKGGVVAG